MPAFPFHHFECRHVQVPGDRECAHFEHNLRLCFAWEDEEQLTEGIERLAHVIRSLQNEKPGDGKPKQSAEKGGAQDFW
jgi:hypothetical protein